MSAPETKGILIESHYLPCIEYLAVITGNDRILVEYHENYQKQSYRNRCRILTAQGPIELSIPVIKSSGKMKITDVEIDYSQKWVKDHWGAIRSAYGNAPFFEHYGEYFAYIYERKPRFLVDLNQEFLYLIFKLLQINPSLDTSMEYTRDPNGKVQDWRSKIHPKKPLKYNPFYKPCNYNQIFGKKFVDNLSIIDLLFCEGPSAGQILKKSRP